MLPWVGYARVSHVGGRTGDSFRSPDDQRHAIEAWAKARHERVVMLPPELDESGGRADRPILQQAIEGIEAGEYRGLVVAYLSRASRSTRHLLELWDRIEAAGGQVMSVAENIDTSTPAGRLTRTMMVAIAEHELDGHRERFEALRRNSTKAGIWKQRQTPLGYSRDPVTRRLVPNDDAPRVVQAFLARETGATMLGLSRQIQMTPSGVRHLLRNRVYLGELSCGPHVNPAAHPAIVDVDLFERVQALAVARGPRDDRQPALLAGIVRCCGCGHVMSRGNMKVEVYACHVNHSLGACPAPAGVTLRLLDRLVEEAVLGALRGAGFDSHEDSHVLSEAREAAGTAERELAAFMEGVAAAGISPVSYARALTARQETVEAARDKVRQALLRTTAVDLGVDIDEAWEAFDMRQRNQLLRGLIEVVLVRRAGGRGGGAGPKIALADRVRIVKAGTGLVGRSVASHSRPVLEVLWPERDDPCLIGVHLSE